MPPLGNKARGMNEATAMWDNCKSCSTTLHMHAQEPSCFFTKGLLNGPFSVIEDRHIMESRCTALGDPYCGRGFRR